MNNSRTLIVIGSIILFFIVLVVKLVDIQILHSEEYSYNAQRQQTGVEKISAERGSITFCLFIIELIYHSLLI